MTSANLSLSDRLKNRKKFINRTLWTSMIALPLLAVYYIFGMVMTMTKVLDYAESQGQSVSKLFNSKLDAVVLVMGFKSAGWLIAMFIAIMFAYQGFSYLFSQSKLDFYLSQPTTRFQRIKSHFADAIGTFVIQFITVEVIALLIAACFGAINGPVLFNVFVETLRTIIVFVVVYMATVLAMFLSGNMPTAVILTGFIGFIPAVIWYESNYLKQIFYCTYTGNHESQELVYLSPLADKISTTGYAHTIKEALNYNLSYNAVFDFLHRNIRYELNTIIFGIIVFVILCIVAKGRKAEDAGKSITFRPFRWFVKIVVCVVCGIFAAIMISLISYGYLNNRMYTLMCIAMVIATVLIGFLIEILFDNYNIRSFLKGKGQTLMAVAIVLLIFFIHRGDLCGYDSYVPNPESVESCAFSTNMIRFDLYDKGTSVFKDYSEQHMYITDVEDFIEIAKAGMKTRKTATEICKKNKYNVWPDLGWDTTIVYRLKNGREIYRTIVIPYDIDSELLNAIVSSKEYKEGAFEVFHDEPIRELAKQKNNGIFEYTSNGESKRSSEMKYEELSDALRKDIIEHYDFNSVKDTLPVGTITYYVSSPQYVYGDMYVYESYENTIALLKKYDLYSKPEFDVSKINELTVTNNAPGYDYEKLNAEEIAGLSINYENAKTVTYSDKESIQKIVGSLARSSSLYMDWYDYSNNINHQYTVQIYIDGANYGRYGVPYFSFKLGEVPDFVIKDTNN